MYIYISDTSQCVYTQMSCEFNKIKFHSKAELLELLYARTGQVQFSAF
jgi:hypothetical protein